MKLPAQVNFIGMEKSDALEAVALEKAARLDLLCASLTSCHVSIQVSHRHHHQGQPFSVHVNLSLPGHQIEASRTENEDPYVALRDAFDDAKRQLEETVQKMHGDKKHHEASAQPGEYAGAEG